MVRLHYFCETVFTENGFPIKRPNYITLGTVETERMAFIGWTWDVSGRMVSPCIVKLNEILRLAYRGLKVGTMDVQLFNTLVGRLACICLGRRPLLSILRHTFKSLEDAQTLSCPDLSPRTKKLQRARKRDNALLLLP